MDLPDLTMGRGNLRVILDHEHQQCGLWSLDTISAATFFFYVSPYLLLLYVLQPNCSVPFWQLIVFRRYRFF